MTEGTAERSSWTW